RALRHYSLPESQHRRRLPAGVAGQGAAVPPGHRAAAGLLDTARRFHGERRDPAAGGLPGNRRGSLRAGQQP
nr:hypothetical protein [Tanacetum cinerariifolium]